MRSLRIGLLSRLGLRLGLLFLCCLGIPWASAQTFNFGEHRLPLASMAGGWRFHPGDDPDFASTALDDTHWATLSSDDGWTSQGYPHLTGFAWYRFRLLVPADGTPYSLLLPEMNTGYQCFLDGHLIVTIGPLRSHAGLVFTAVTPVPIPVVIGPRGANAAPLREVQVALRVWHSPVWSSFVGGGPTPGSAAQELFGPTAEVARYKGRNTEHLQFRNTVWLALGGLDLLAGLASLALFLLRRAEREYLWFGIAVLAPGLKFLLNFYGLGDTVSVAAVDGGANLATMMSHLAFLAFYRRLLGGRADALFRVAVGCILLYPVPLILLEGVGSITPSYANFWNIALQWPYCLWILILLVRRSLEGSLDRNLEGNLDRKLDARLLLAPVALFIGLDQLTSVAFIAEEAGARLKVHPENWNLQVPFPVAATDLAWMLFLLAILLILLYRFARTRREEEAYAAEFESARQVQMLLVPEALEPVPGFAVQAEYRPARVVGGDFYQVLPTEEGGLLVVVGDVAGKGLPAAMLVSMLVGAVRTQAAVSSDPAEMLQTLNERLLGRVNGGFSTCVAARISPTGTLEIANAGHPSPYRNGDELELAGALPLGVISDPDYVTETLQLHRGDRLTLLTDGIPEAQNASRQLFGFESTRLLSIELADVIVDTAQRFGQEDDLTAVTIDFLLYAHA